MQTLSVIYVNQLSNLALDTNNWHRHQHWHTIEASEQTEE